MLLSVNPHFLPVPVLVLTSFIIFHLFSTSHLVVSASSSSSSEATLPLLTWKSGLDNGSQSLLSSWVKTASPCRWFGIRCEIAGVVTHINLANFGFSGTLHGLNFSLFPLLQNLDLHNNSFSGPIPSSVFGCSNLSLLDLALNNFSGEIPPDIGRLTSLTLLNLGKNNLMGSIPASIGDLGNLTALLLYTNNLSGHIPPSIGNLLKLEYLSLQQNSLTGPVPPGIGNLQALSHLRLYMNRLSGPLPQGMNNLTNLKLLRLGINNLSGSLPDNLCLGGLLQWFTAGRNSFTGVPKGLKNCTSLLKLSLSRNQFSGNISEDFGVYPGLYYINLGYNKFLGELSPNWGLCSNMSDMNLSNNNITGRIPPEFGSMTRLGILDLSSNLLEGKIPRSLGNLASLIQLNLSHNQLSGGLPPEVNKLSNLEQLDLGDNNFSGSIQVQLKECVKLWNLNLSRNAFSNHIPPEIGSMKYLQSLDLSWNSLTDEIPPQLGELHRLQMLILSHNELSGSIPSSFQGLISLTLVDMSYNQLEGPVPSIKAIQEAPSAAFEHNRGLCGNVSGLKPCNSLSSNKGNGTGIRKVMIFTIPSLVTLLVLFLVFSLYYCLISNERRTESSPKFPNDTNDENMFNIWSFDGEILYENIIEATNDFNPTHCVGEGGYGTVYKARLPTGQLVAVKKLHVPQDSSGNQMRNLKSFSNEIQALTQIRHRHIVKLHGFCSNEQHSFLVYEFLEGGCLWELLNNDEKAAQLDWEKRIDIVKGVADALSYMHHDCKPPIVHRDISSKNVLLDANCFAHVSDFGTATVLKPGASNWTSFAGTYGYAAPELAYTMEVKEQQDVYSFGVLLIEVIMGRHPGDLVLSSSSLFEASSLHGKQLKDVLDQRIALPSMHEEEEVACIFNVASACLSIDSHLRPTMQQVSAALQAKPTLKDTMYTKTFNAMS